ncbi:MAG: hypothetical protein A3F72_13220 [Bacteroidetes bacterium RIFCSPLOWO2_12_FULL_35_15]|nr:MAG: hypothetical protein A3F72_13220 [Bacteroidetes bacterium RIFCSPLOWO2_12_FULL_35_15]
MKSKYFFSIAFILIIKSLTSQSLPDLIKNGNTKLASADYAGAEIDFAKAIKVNVTVVGTYLDKLKKYNAMNEYQRSTSDMPDGFMYKHDLAVPYYGHGLALAGLGKQNDALADFEKAIAIDISYADAFCERGIIYIKLGEKNKGCIDLLNAKIAGSDKAKSLYEKSACSDVSKAFISSGNTKFDAKDYIGAIADYNYAIQLNSESVDALIKAGECYTMLKKYDKAITNFKKAQKIAPENMEVLYDKGLTYNAMENFKEAFNDLSVVIKKDPNNYEAYMQRGISCEGMQNFNSAVYDYSEAIRIKPKDGMAYYKRGLATQDQKSKTVCKDFKMAAALGIEDAKPLAENCKPEVKVE